MKLKPVILTGALLLASAGTANAGMLEQLSLSEMTNRSDAVFRGTVIDVQQSTIAAGGADIPAVLYRIRVEDMLKGQADVTKGDEQYMEVRMVGTLKPKAADGNIRRLSIFDDVPKLNMGSDYVLFMTPESSAGLSVTVGLGQGAFNIMPSDKEDMVVNLYGNQNLGMNGPVSYADLKTAVATAGN